MKERPILFSGPMVRTILDGSKTQTRRIFKLPKWAHAHDKGDDIAGETPQVCHRDSGCLVDVLCPYGQAGDQLWVKETFLNNALASYPPVYFYRADGDEKPEDRQWKPSIFMPRSASRITLEIQSVRVERLQDIPEEDAKAEGVEIITSVDHGSTSPVLAYKSLWESINGKCSWAKNPWVWVIQFQRIASPCAEVIAG